MDSDRGTDLRDRLSEALEQVSPSLAPVDAVLAGARRLRTTRRAIAGAGVVAVAAAAVAAAVILPGAGHRGTPPASSPTPTGPAGSVVIGSGSIDGQSWQVVVDQAAGRICAGVADLRRSCVTLHGLGRVTGLASLAWHVGAGPWPSAGDDGATTVECVLRAGAGRRHQDRDPGFARPLF